MNNEHSIILNKTFTNDKNEKIEKNILDSGKKSKFDYSKKKTMYSSETTKYIDKESFCLLDLNKKIKELVIAIKKWNQLL